ncbi:hypothetical protein [Azospirillum sp. SYSU D00513]|uniref:hypothetical protein n=1 Tax=Azospirillum sp. SYSU D00513 TaxID=2812561 RepID=UPI001A96B0EE|nr:hypothetical protein [Azospirillum sp. SYSU D00513]
MAAHPPELARARRRRDLARMKAKARRLWPDDPDAHRLADHLAFCPNRGCANPRHWEGHPFRDLRAFQAFQDEP